MFKKSPEHPISCGFTIIELLVVITIMIILLSILLPALTELKKSVKKIDCLNNLKQMGIVMESYVSDYNGYIPPCWVKNPATLAWGRLLKDLGYIQNYSILQCKSAPERVLTTSAYGLTNYAYNNYAGWDWDTDPVRALVKMSQIKMPSKDALIIDGECTTYPEFYCNTNGSISWLDYRHQNGANALFLDGHGAWHRQLDPYFTAEDPDYCGRWAKRKY